MPSTLGDPEVVGVDDVEPFDLAFEYPDFGQFVGGEAVELERPEHCRVMDMRAMFLDQELGYGRRFTQTVDVKHVDQSGRQFIVLEHPVDVLEEHGNVGRVASESHDLALGFDPTPGAIFVDDDIGMTVCIREFGDRQHVGCQLADQVWGILDRMPDHVEDFAQVGRSIVLLAGHVGWFAVVEKNTFLCDRAVPTHLETPFGLEC